MKKIVLLVSLPVAMGYLLFGIGWYIIKKDDAHFAILNDIVMWLWE